MGLSNAKLPRRRAQRRARDHRGIAVVIPVALFLTACQTPVSVKPIDPIARYDSQHQNVLRSERPSALTAEILRLLHLEAEFKEHPTTVLRRLNRLERGVQPESAQYALAELSLLEGRRTETRAPVSAQGLYLLAAARAYDFLFHRSASFAQQAFDFRSHLMIGVYNQATARYIKLLHREESKVADHRLSVFDEEFSVAIGKGVGLWDPNYFDRLLPAEDYRIKGLRNRHVDGGLGAPLIAFRENRQLTAIERYYPPEGIVFPATAILHFGSANGTTAGSRSVTLAFYNPAQASTARIGSVDVPVAADLTAPFAYLIARTDLVKIGRTGLFTYRKATAHRGLFLLQPYDPNKIPVIMIHGLASSPLAWMELTNDLAGHPKLRHAYQFWHYMYPTGLPFLYSANQFRKSLEDLRYTLDPTGRDAALQSMVIVAHSLGGLLAKTTVSESGTRIWDATFKVPPEKLKGTAEDIKQARGILFFSPKPYVHRVIFIATPHRGSKFADNIVGRAASSTVKLPDAFKDLWRRITEANSDVTTPAMRTILAKGGPTSIRALSPEHPLTRVMSEIPIDQRVSYHLIMGDRGRGGGDATSDGFVTYASAHIPGAESEVIVPTGHMAYTHPLAIAEIKRILEQVHADTGMPIRSRNASRRVNSAR